MSKWGPHSYTAGPMMVTMREPTLANSAAVESSRSLVNREGFQSDSLSKGLYLRQNPSVSSQAGVDGPPLHSVLQGRTSQVETVYKRRS